MSGKEIRVNPGSRLNGWHGCAPVLCTVSLQQYHTRAEGVALGHRRRKSQSSPIYQLCLLKGRADAALDFDFTDLTPGFMGRIQPHIAGHHLNKYLSRWKGPGRRAACLVLCSPSSLSQLHTGSLSQGELTPHISIATDGLVSGLCQGHTSISSTADGLLSL